MRKKNEDFRARKKMFYIYVYKPFLVIRKVSCYRFLIKKFNKNFEIKKHAIGVLLN